MTGAGEEKRGVSSLAWAGLGCALLGVLVIGVVVLIVLGGAFGFIFSTQLSPEERVQSDLRAFEAALNIYQSKTLRLPSSNQGLKALVEKPTADPIPRQWSRQMMRVPLDPWGREYDYRFPGLNNSESYDLRSAGPDGVFDTKDDIGNWDSE